MWRHSNAALRRPSGHFDVSPRPSLFCISFSHGSLCQRWDVARPASANAVTQGAGSEGGACEAFDVDDWMQVLDFTLPQFQTTKTGKEGTRGAEAWRRNRNKPIGERTPASLEEKPFSPSPSPVLSLSAAHTGNHLGWTSSFHPAGWWLPLGARNCNFSTFDIELFY